MLVVEMEAFNRIIGAIFYTMVLFTALCTFLYILTAVLTMAVFHTALAQ